MWLDGSYTAYCATNALADTSADTHRNARRDADPNALTFGKPVA
jgi:hypothetical protein